MTGNEASSPVVGPAKPCASASAAAEGPADAEPGASGASGAELSTEVAEPMPPGLCNNVILGNSLTKHDNMAINDIP